MRKDAALGLLRLCDRNRAEGESRISQKETSQRRGHYPDNLFTPLTMNESAPSGCPQLFSDVANGIRQRGRCCTVNPQPSLESESGWSKILHLTNRDTNGNVHVHLWIQTQQCRATGPLHAQYRAPQICFKYL